MHVIFFFFSRNPMGRTGLRGKGALPRWGPNHNVFAIITRWETYVPLFNDTVIIQFTVELEINKLFLTLEIL